MTELEKFLLKNNTFQQENHKVILPRLGDDNPIELRILTSKEVQSISARSQTKNGTTDEQLLAIKLCVCGIVDPALTKVENIKNANKAVIEYNADVKKAADELNKRALKAWEKDGGDESNKPKEIEPDYKSEIMNAEDLLSFYFLPGEITQIANKIMDISGFNVSIKDAVKEAKN